LEDKILSEYEYEVGLSYASEQRSYVRPIAEELRNKGIKVFYDEFEMNNYWGRNVNDWFFEIFRHKLKFCVMFISADYKRKINTRWEFNAAIAKQKSLVDAEYILPISFDGETFDSLNHIGCLKSEDFNSKQMAKQIVDKLKEATLKNPTVDSAENFLRLLQNGLKPLKNIKTNIKTKNELEIESDFNNGRFLKFIFRIGDIYNNINKITVYENFSGCIAPNGVLSAEFEVINQPYMNIVNYCLFDDKCENACFTMSLSQILNALENRFEEIKYL